MNNCFVIDVPGILENCRIPYKWLGNNSISFELRMEKCGAKFYPGRNKWYWTDWENPTLRGDAVDLYIELTGCDRRSAWSMVCGESTEIDYIALEKVTSNTIKRQQKLDDRNKDIRFANIARLDEAIHSTRLLSEALNARGISIDDLPSDVLENIFTVVNCKLQKLLKSEEDISEHVYPVTGLVFKCGSENETRRVRTFSIKADKSVDFSTLGKAPKVMSIGANGVFNSGCLNDGAPVFITEGEIDCLSVLAIGYNAISIPGVSSARKLISDLCSNGLLKPGKKVIIAVDTDSPGRECCAELKNTLARNNISASSIDYYDGYKDINAWYMADKSVCRKTLKNLVYKVIHDINE